MTLRLYRGDLLLGSVEIDWAKADFPWHGGAFTPTPHFEAVRPLFDAELALRGQPPEWDKAYAQIVQPGLRLEDPETGKVHRHVLLHIIHGQEARFRIIAQPSSRWMRIALGRSGSRELPTGAWSPGSFDNDEGRELVWSELQDAESTEPIAEALGAGLGARGPLETGEASVGLAAAEVVAALLGKPAAILPDEVAAWVAGKPPPEPGLVNMAQRLVKRVLEGSGLKDLWAESEGLAKWEQEAEGLLARLEDRGVRKSD
jgi:hypothetical protein